MHYSAATALPTSVQLKHGELHTQDCWLVDCLGAKTVLKLP
jgi:hypothetical protein